ncbi:MAG: hypothetical protein LBH68_06275 [Bifidobacteriaceae bacterium]|jgi:hypothetical protein|nr:hypothetical protein [Bifidobacteriaceae bacterium]
MNSLRYPPEEPVRPRPEDLFVREPKRLDTYRVPDYATGALPLTTIGLTALALAVAGLTLALFPWVGAFIGAPLGAAALILATVAAGRIRRGLDRGAPWVATAAGLGLAAVVVGILLNVEELLLAT